MMIINQGCNSICFLSVDLPNLLDWNTLQNRRFDAATGQVEYDQAVKTVLKEFGKCIRMDSSQGVLGGVICNAFDMAYLHKVSGSIAMIGCKDESSEQKKFIKAMINKLYPFIMEGVCAVYIGSTVNVKTTNIVACHPTT